MLDLTPLPARSQEFGCGRAHLARLSRPTMRCSLRTLASLPGATDIVLVELAEQVHRYVAAEEVRVDLKGGNIPSASRAARV